MKGMVGSGLALAGLLAAAGLSPLAGMQGPQGEVPALEASHDPLVPGRGLEVVADRLYTMHAGIRPLYLFWIRKDNVGSAVIRQRQGDDGSHAYELTVGSDPDRAPRRVNRWGYLSEEKGPSGIALLGIMKTSEEESLEEAERQVQHEGKAGLFRYKAIRTDVVGDKGRTGTYRVEVERDFCYRDLEQLLALIPSKAVTEREYRLPAGVRGGYIGTVHELLRASVASYRAKGQSPKVEGRPLRYIYNGFTYDMVLKSSKFKKEARFKGRQFTNLIEGHFRITNLTTGYKTEFRIDYGAEGELAAIPVHVVFQPRWWLEVELVLDESRDQASGISDRAAKRDGKSRRQSPTGVLQ